MVNLSQTCFLSAILQALLHNPLWKQYYLSDSHDRRACALRRAKATSAIDVKAAQLSESTFEGPIGAEEMGPGGLTGVRLADIGLSFGGCMGCEMDGAFAEVSHVRCRSLIDTR